MPRIPTRLRALGLTGLSVVVLLAAAPVEYIAAVGPVPVPVPDAAAAATSPAVTLVAASPIGSALTGARAGEPAVPGAATSTPAAAPAAPATVPAAAVVVAFARSHLRAPYRHFGTGPTSFDCSGLMWRVFHEAGLGRKVTSRSARAIYLAYLRRGLASRRHPQVGDLIVWGHGSHVGVYIGGGYAISALINGVRVHRVRAMFTPFTAYLHTHLAGLVKPAWELVLARHIRSLRHTTHAVFLRATPSGSGARVGSLRTGTRFVVLARHRDSSGRLWLQALTFGGRRGWLPLALTAR